MHVNGIIPEERNDIVLKHAFEEEDENEEEVMDFIIEFMFLSTHRCDSQLFPCAN